MPQDKLEIEGRVVKPNLFIVGAPKCGTTAWAQYLGAHPDVFFSPVKEPHYFCADFPNWRIPKTEEEYLALFERSGSAKIVGEASVFYLRSETAARSIHAFSPEAKIVILLRNQSEFLPSYHNQMIFNGEEAIVDFDTVWRMSGNRDPSTISDYSREPRLLDYRCMGRFSQQLERYFSVFPAEQIRVFHFDDWVRAPRAAYLEMMTFLGLDDDGRTEFPRVNEPKRRRTKLVTRLVRRPPKPLRVTVRAIKRLTGRESLGLAEWARQLDTRKGTRTQVSQAVKDEIRAYYAEDNALLDPRIWRPVCGC